MRPRDKKRTAAKQAVRKIRAAQRATAQAAGRPFKLSVPVTIKAASERQDGRRPFTMTAYTGEPLTLPRFDLPVVIDCASVDLTAQSIPALLEHQAYTDSVVGQIESIQVTGAGGTPPIIAAGYFTPTDDPKDAATFVMKKADAGFKWQASVGGNPAKVDRIEAGQTVAVNGRTYAGPVYVARGTHFREISFTVLGADRLTSVAARHTPTIKGTNAMDEGFAQWLLAMGFDSPDTLSPVQLANLQRMYDEEAAEPAEPVEAAKEPEPKPEPNAPTNAAAVTPAIQASATAPTPSQPNATTIERNRVTAIADLCELATLSPGGTAPTITVTAGSPPVSLQAHAVAEGWDVDRVRREVLNAVRNSRPVGPSVVIRGKEKDLTIQALQAAMVLRFAGDRYLDNPAYRRIAATNMLPPWMRAEKNDAAKNQTMEAAYRYCDLSAVDLARECNRLDGKDVHGRDASIQAAFSGSTLSNIFSTNVNAILLATYFEAEDSTKGWTRENMDVPNYLLQERTRMVKGGNLSKQPAGAEADHTSRSDTSESYKIARYSRQFQVDEIDFINDNLGGLKDVPTEMAMAAARLRPDLVYAILLANPTLAATARALFNSTDGNAKTTAALAADKLRAAVSAMWLFTENNVNLNLRPTHIVVPPSLRHLATELTGSPQIFLRGSTDAERGVNNAIRADDLTVIADSRLENGVVDPDSGTTYSGSSSTWYLACALAQTIEVGYLRGSGGAPRVRSGQLDQGKFGLWWDVSLSVGAKALDWKGFVRNVA